MICQLTVVVVDIRGKDDLSAYGRGGRHIFVSSHCCQPITYACAHRYTHTHLLMHIFPHKNTCLHTHTMFTHTYTHTCSCITHTHLLVHTHAHTYTHKSAHNIHTHLHTHTYTHTHTHLHTPTQTHIHLTLQSHLDTRVYRCTSQKLLVHISTTHIYTQIHSHSVCPKSNPPHPASSPPPLPSQLLTVDQRRLDITHGAEGGHEVMHLCPPLGGCFLKLPLPLLSIHTCSTKQPG